jgi:polysaccharide export outer membrane protein
MARCSNSRIILTFVAFAGFWFLSAGCQTVPNRTGDVNPFPSEMRRVSEPPYVIEPPDVLQIDAINIVPKPPYRIKPLDSLIIRATRALPRFPIDGTFGVDPEGTVTLTGYGVVSVVNLTLEEAAAAIVKQMKLQGLVNPEVTVALATSRAYQQVRGPHLVGLDGTVSLGTYGAVTVAGLTVTEAKQAIELHLSQYLLDPEVSVIVSGFNSKVYYLIFDGAGNGFSIARLPVTGGETVLDALAAAGGLPPQASLKNIYIARPSPNKGCDQILPVDMAAIMKRGSPATNYQILPNDRLYVKAEALSSLDTMVTRVAAPLERLMGLTLLGISTVETIKNPSTGNGLIGFGVTPVIR